MFIFDPWYEMMTSHSFLTKRTNKETDVFILSRFSCSWLPGRNIDHILQVVNNTMTSLSRWWNFKNLKNNNWAMKKGATLVVWVRKRGWKTSQLYGDIWGLFHYPSKSGSLSNNQDSMESKGPIFFFEAHLVTLRFCCGTWFRSLDVHIFCKWRKSTPSIYL